YDAFTFHYVTAGGVTYLAMGDESKHRVPFAFLDEVKRRFEERYGERAMTAIAFSMNDEFSPVLRECLDYFNENPAVDTIGAVQGQIDDVKSVMVENIEKVLQRGEKIELLVDKTDRLNQQAYKFERQSKKLKQAMWWKKIKMYMALALVAALVVFIISAMACGGLDFHSCK
ncbi:hypothetical protein TeGR_g13259, partial [Tetraparma gracilis]